MKKSYMLRHNAEYESVLLVELHLGATKLESNFIIFGLQDDRLTEFSSQVEIDCIVNGANFVSHWSNVDLTEDI